MNCKLCESVAENYEEYCCSCSRTVDRWKRILGEASFDEIFEMINNIVDSKIKKALEAAEDKTYELLDEHTQTYEHSRDYD